MTNFKLWLRIAAVLQLLTAVFHSISFFVDPVPQNDTERTLIDLMNNYRQDAGGGVEVTMQELFTGLSACFTLICAFGGWLNFYLVRKTQDIALLRGVLGIEVVIFGVVFAVMAVFTFLPPIVCTGLIFLSLLIAWFLSKRNL